MGGGSSWAGTAGFCGVVSKWRAWSERTLGPDKEIAIKSIGNNRSAKVRASLITGWLRNNDWRIIPLNDPSAFDENDLKFERIQLRRELVSQTVNPLPKKTYYKYCFIGAIEGHTLIWTHPTSAKVSLRCTFADVTILWPSNRPVQIAQESKL